MKQLRPELSGYEGRDQTISIALDTAITTASDLDLQNHSSVHMESPVDRYAYHNFGVSWPRWYSRGVVLYPGLSVPVNDLCFCTS